MRIIIPLVVIIVAYASVAHASVHVPPGDAVAGTPLELVVEAPPATPSLVAHYRAGGTTAYTALELVRKDDAHWVAVIPATAVVVPGLDYYIDAGGEPIFATEKWPHTTLVKPSSDDARRSRDIKRSEARRYRMHVLGELVDFGSQHTPSGQALTDSYYRIDADFRYRLWAYPLEELEFGYTRLLGNAPSSDGMAEVDPAPGFKVGGWFGLGVAPIEGLRIDGHVMVLATQQFQVGATGEARAGALDGNHIALGFEYFADAGADGYFRLGWGTIPGFPMSATVEATNMPLHTNNVGVRLYYDVAHEVAAGLRIGVRVGYAARDQQISGYTSGASATWDF